MHMVALLQVWCANCAGNDMVTYEWTMDSLSDDASIQTFDWSRFAVIGQTDASLTINPSAFEEITETEHYAFVLTGARCVHF